MLDIKQDSTLSDHYKIKLVPTQLFIDPLSRELYRHEGFFSHEEIVANWKELGFDLSMHSR
ncbi:MAG: hypothetical protein A2Z25_12120 [Planctomycetes bacterium RBG_16_55_9]|nr:MAG: hypothetical protein A2Z25_12120 [Planctomycetes bacterium RBG_16_55_9]